MLKELRSQHRTIVQMSFSGFKNNEIAEKMGMTPSTVSQILRSPLGQAYLNGLIDKSQEDTLDVRKKLISLNQSALGTIERILDPKIKAPFNVQLTAAKDVLDRNGYKPSDKFEIDVYSHKSDDEIEAEIRAMEATIARNQITKALPAEEFSAASNDSSEPDQDFPGVTPCSEDTDQDRLPDVVASSQTYNNCITFPKDAFPGKPQEQSGLPPDIEAKLSDEAFNPFNNID
jgi:predicted transcriptional regulator